jgi:hypothetical protein
MMLPQMLQKNNEVSEGTYERISDPEQGFFVKPDPDPDPGF